jgi:hypothetical protein
MLYKKMTLGEQNPMSNNKLLQYLHEMLSVENAAIERLESRIQQSLENFNITCKKLMSNNKDCATLLKIGE